MSRFLNESYKDLTAYVPGEQPKDRRYVKLNTNESPFPPSPYALRLARQAASDINLYSDPECGDLTAAASEIFGIEKENIIFTNGSDEALSRFIEETRNKCVWHFSWERSNRSFL